MFLRLRRGLPVLLPHEGLVTTSYGHVDDLCRNLLEMAQLPLELQGLADANEDYWERGGGHQPPLTNVRYENLGIYGWDVRDAISSTAARAAAARSVGEAARGVLPGCDGVLSGLWGPHFVSWVKQAAPLGFFNKIKWISGGEIGAADVGCRFVALRGTCRLAPQQRDPIVDI